VVATLSSRGAHSLDVGRCSHRPIVVALLVVVLMLVAVPLLLQFF
jgi:hypothetical protein